MDGSIRMNADTSTNEMYTEVVTEVTEMKQTITFTIQLDVDAEQAAKLPGYPGTGSPGTSYGDADVPVSGLDIESSIIAGELAQRAKELLPEKLRPQIVWRDYTLGLVPATVW